MDQPHWTGVGIYAVELFKLLNGKVNDLKLIYTGAVWDDFYLYDKSILLLEPLKNNDTFGDTFMKTLIGSTQDIQATFKDSRQCASYYLELFKSVMAS